MRFLFTAPCRPALYVLFSYTFLPPGLAGRVASEKCMWHKWQSATLINKIVGLLPTDSNNMHGTNNRNQQTKCDLRNERNKNKIRDRNCSLFVIWFLLLSVFWQTEVCQHFSLCAKRLRKRITVGGWGDCCIAVGINFLGPTFGHLLTGQPSKCNYRVDSIFLINSMPYPGLPANTKLSCSMYFPGLLTHLACQSEDESGSVAGRKFFERLTWRMRNVKPNNLNCTKSASTLLSNFNCGDAVCRLKPKPKSPYHSHSVFSQVNWKVKLAQLGEWKGTER